jgi:hypothetical protein
MNSTTNHNPEGNEMQLATSRHCRIQGQKNLTREELIEKRELLMEEVRKLTDQINSTKNVALRSHLQGMQEAYQTAINFFAF